MKRMRLLLVTSLTLLFASCSLISPDITEDEPSVIAVTPADGATDVSAETSVEAQLELHGSELNVVTLTGDYVQLSSPEGIVAADLTLNGDTIVLDPLEPLASETTYTFTVTEGIQTTNGSVVAAFQSSFQTEFVETPEPGEGIPGLTMLNALGLPSQERMVLSKVDNSGDPCFDKPDGCDPTRWLELQSRDTGTVVLQNTGAATLELTLSSSQPELYSVAPAAVTVPAGGRSTAEVTFLGAESKGVYSALINAETSSGTPQRSSLEVIGIYQTRPEGTSELTFGQIIEALGYQTELGTDSSGKLTSDETDSPLSGYEVRSRFWQAADPGEEIVVTQLAAFMTCCTSSPTLNDFEFFAQNSSSYFFRLGYDTGYAQSIFPSGETGDVPNQASVTTNQVFRFDIAGFSSKDGTEDGYLGVRFWPLIDEPNTYIVAQDFARGPCGTSSDDDSGISSNCDYNDHIYIVSNIEPLSGN